MTCLLAADAAAVLAEPARQEMGIVQSELAKATVERWFTADCEIT